MRNAFELLASGAKGKGSSKTPAGSKSSYATCPLCQRTVPLSFADAHQDHPSGSSPSPGLGASTPQPDARSIPPPHFLPGAHPGGPLAGTLVVKRTGCVTAAQQRLVGSSCWSVTLTVGLGPRVAAVASGGGGDGGSNGKETVVLLTNVPPGDGGEISWSSGGLPSNDLPPEGRWRGGPSVLKSALQKAVRLGRGSCAVRTALHLDAILHPGLPLVVWLMAAQAKGFVLGRAHGDALLPLVYQLAMVQVRDGLPDDPWDSGDPAAMGSSAGTALQGPATLQQVDEMALPALESCLVKCLLFRASYGGMGGDVRMMRAFAGYWAARFKSSAAQPPPPPGQPEGPPSRSTIGPPSAGLSETRPAPLDNAVGEGSEVRGNAHMTQEPAALAMAGCSSQATPGDVRVPDTYFATRLQAEDAPPSCTVFVPASQLLKEAVSEQCALRRLAAVAAARPISPAAAPPPPPPPPQPSPASCTSSADGIFPSYTQTSLTQQQYQPAAGDEVVRPRWHGVGQGDCMVHADAAVLASDSTSGGKGVDSSDQLSPWLAFLCNLYDQVLATVASVGPMRRSDVPLSAVDFHVSDVITRLMERPELQALAPGADSEHRSLEAQLTREDAARRRLEVLWTAAAPWADRFSVSFIARRFGPP
ncbi:hypothetical protein VOLCADRAFT_116903 [Volvox carteri f. nagariensis]|uniref:Uncharacterized protein n=1 Tax=Volvox carteri f. nagariensis TaxID=3068 RepID=D8TQC1_VOLCA|nr:uncharacterized protein VOLCADRAFT_116903 [Volvox carteri f. nagariensis]EFJ50508.1 hypothetical protein VOLCADRAFT_116903 [Volvox carteri f. nagariensis]|eukprot:XP_002948633.1 hypothetical protein VOLCADRAFT_116903 [Volvox carteri f. nagariensis]